jgi:hypothetical protein
MRYSVEGHAYYLIIRKKGQIIASLVNNIPDAIGAVVVPPKSRELLQSLILMNYVNL